MKIWELDWEFDPKLEELLKEMETIIRPKILKERIEIKGDLFHPHKRFEKRYPHSLIASNYFASTQIVDKTPA